MNNNRHLIPVLAVLLGLLFLTPFASDAQRRIPIEEEDDCIDCEPTRPTVTISGPASVIVQDYDYYYVRVSGASHYSTSYSVSGGRIISQSKTNVRVQWTTVGTGRYVRAVVRTNAGTYTRFKYVTVNAGLPPTPLAPWLYSQDCGYSYARKGTAPPGVKWYWQTTPSGRSIASQAEIYRINTSSKRIYLRAKSSTGWSINSSSYYVPVKTVPKPPSSPTISNNCGNKTLTRGNPPSGVTWYWQGKSNTSMSTSNSNRTYTATSSGTYYIRAKSSNGCWSLPRAIKVVINPLPNVYSVTGGGSYCSGGNGVTIGLSDTQSGVRYQLKRGSTNVGAPIAGTNHAISFPKQRTAGTYTVRATNASTNCARNMSGSKTVTINSLPNSYSITGGGSYCSGGNGVDIGLNDSQTGVRYQLKRGSSNVGSPINGTGNAIGFGKQKTSGTYTVVATRTSTNCSRTMSGNKTISINALPVAYSVFTSHAGGNSRCFGEGITIRLNGSENGVNYQLKRGNTNIGSPVAGTGNVINFPNYQRDAGTYWVVASNASTHCSRNMNDNVIINPPLAVHNVTGSGGYCSYESGKEVGLDNSQAGVNYQLKLNGANIGPPTAGTGGPINFGIQKAGLYKVLATHASTNCASWMNSTANVYIYSNHLLDPRFLVTGGGTYCTGGNGASVGLSDSRVGVSYQLLDGNTPMGSPLAGTGTTLDFGVQPEGYYNVTATVDATGCTWSMYDRAEVIIDDSEIPLDLSMTGGGRYCTGGSGVVVGVSDSEVGVKYQLMRDGIDVGTPLNGTGQAISFGRQKVVGTYTAMGTRTNYDGCSQLMRGDVKVRIDDHPLAYTVSGDGFSCYYENSPIGLSSSEVGVSYQLVEGNVSIHTNIGAPITGTGNALDFGLHPRGHYNVVAKRGNCSTYMNWITKHWNMLPWNYRLTGGGVYCEGSGMGGLSLTESHTSVDYQLFRNSVEVGEPIRGTGEAISFGIQSESGSYWVIGTNVITGCTNRMLNNRQVTVKDSPTAFAITGGGDYCSGESGVVIGITDSENQIRYRLLRDGVVVTAAMGTGEALNFVNQTIPGVYTADGRHMTTDCLVQMTGSTAVNEIDCSSSSSRTHIVSNATNEEKNEPDENELILYPNPTNGQITLFGAALVKGPIRIYDLNGKPVLSLYHVNKPSVTLDVSDLQLGVYILKIGNDSAFLTRKLVIK